MSAGRALKELIGVVLSYDSYMRIGKQWMKRAIEVAANA